MSERRHRIPGMSQKHIFSARPNFSSHDKTFRRARRKVLSCVQNVLSRLPGIFPCRQDDFSYEKMIPRHDKRFLSCDKWIFSLRAGFFSRHKIVRNPHLKPPGAPLKKPGNPGLARVSRILEGRVGPRVRAVSPWGDETITRRGATRHTLQAFPRSLPWQGAEGDCRCSLMKAGGGRIG